VSVSVSSILLLIKIDQPGKYLQDVMVCPMPSPLTSRNLRVAVFRVQELTQPEVQISSKCIQMSHKDRGTQRVVCGIRSSQSSSPIASWAVDALALQQQQPVLVVVHLLHIPKLARPDVRISKEL
jgi:hypothetical protein